MARTPHARAGRGSGRHAGRDAQECRRPFASTGRGDAIAQVFKDLPLRDAPVKGPVCRQRTLLSEA